MIKLKDLALQSHKDEKKNLLKYGTDAAASVSIRPKILIETPVVLGQTWSKFWRIMPDLSRISSVKKVI